MKADVFFHCSNLYRSTKKLKQVSIQHAIPNKDSRHNMRVILKSSSTNNQYQGTVHLINQTFIAELLRNTSSILASITDRIQMSALRLNKWVCCLNLLLSSSHRCVLQHGWPLYITVKRVIGHSH